MKPDKEEPPKVDLWEAFLYLFWGSVLTYFFYGSIQTTVADWIRSQLPPGL